MNKNDAPISIVKISESNDSLIINENNCLQKLKKIKQGFVENLLTGKVRFTSPLKKDTP